MSKAKQRRRAVRKRETAVRAAARAGSAERRERQQARKRPTDRGKRGNRPGRGSRTGRQTGVLARRRRRQHTLLAVGLLAVNAVVWVLRPDWEARLAALMLSVLIAPLLGALLFRRR